MRLLVITIAAFTSLASLPTTASAWFLSDIPAEEARRTTLQEMFAAESESQPLTRAMLVSHVVDALYPGRTAKNCFKEIDPKPSTPFTFLFTDVTVNHPNAAQLCVALDQGLIRGNRFGAFEPDRVATLAETSKILARAYGLPSIEDQTPWYMDALHSLLSFKILPTSAAADKAVTIETVRTMLSKMPKATVEVSSAE